MGITFMRFLKQVLAIFNVAMNPTESPYCRVQVRVHGIHGVFPFFRPTIINPINPVKILYPNLNDDTINHCHKVMGVGALRHHSGYGRRGRAA